MNRSLPPKNPFVYGRILTVADAACARTELETRVEQTVRDNGRLALVGDRRMGKSSLVQRTLEELKVPMLRLNFHEVVDLNDVVLRTVVQVEQFLRDRSPIARRLVPWMREVGLEIRELRASISGVEIKVSAGIHTDQLMRALGFIRDAAKRTPLALFIDELQDISDRLPETTGNAALAIIRDLTQQMPNCPVFYAGSARASFTLLFTSDSSPFYQHAALAYVEPFPAEPLQAFIVEQFKKGHGIDPAAAVIIRSIAGDSINDVQLLCHETWNEHLTNARPANAATVQRGLDQVLRDQTPFCEKWLEELSNKQLRLVFAVTFLGHLGASTSEFLEFAGIRNPGDVERALATTLAGKEALLEKNGSRYRFRSRFARLWFARRFARVQALVPEMRMPEVYQRRLQFVFPEISGELKSE